MTVSQTGSGEDGTGFGHFRASPPRLHSGGDAGKSKRLTAVLRGLVPLALLLAVWQITGSPQSPYFPPPSTWAGALADLWAEGVLLPAGVATLKTLFLAILVATGVGALLGLLVGSSGAADRALGPSLEFARGMPPAAVVPVATLLIGYDLKMKAAVVVLAAIWPVLLNTRTGVQGLDPVLRDTARSLNLSRLDRVRKVSLPALLPAIFLGVRVAAPIALVITLLVEILTQVPGVGALLSASQRSFLSARVYGLILVAGLFSLAVSGLLSAMEAYLFRWRPGPMEEH